MTERHSDRGRAQRDALADVLAQGAVEMGFQPIVELATDSVIGWEALARGPHGTPLEYPDALFEAARAAGRLEELDWLCQRRALTGALAAGPEPSHVLFLNLEAGATGFLPLELRTLYCRATSQMTVAVEVTERALCARPAALLGHVADMRALGCAIALDDVGTEPSSLAMMALLRPDVVKLDLELVSTKPELSDSLAAVAGHARAMAATLVVERVERTEQVDFAQAIGAQLGQGWLFGRRAPLEDAPPAPAGPVVRHESRPDPRDTAPFALVAATRAPHVAGEALVGDVAREVEEQARAAGGQALLVAAFGEAQRFTPDLRERYAGLARDIAFCGAIAHDMATEPAPGVHGGSLDASDPLSHDLTVAVVAPGFAAAIAAHDLGPGEPEDRRMAYTVTHDRDLATDAAAALMSRITG